MKDENIMIQQTRGVMIHHLLKSNDPPMTFIIIINFSEIMNQGGRDT